MVGELLELGLPGGIDRPVNLESDSFVLQCRDGETPHLIRANPREATRTGRVNDQGIARRGPAIIVACDRLELCKKRHGMSKEPTDQQAAENSWYYLLDGETLGPVPGSELRRLFRSGSLVPDTLVWRPGMVDWLPARALGVGTPKPPPVPTVAAPVRPATPPRETPPPGAVARTRATAAVSSGGRRSGKWRAQFVAVCVLAALALLVSGVGIGLLLRSPADKTSDERRVAVQKNDQLPVSTRGSTDRPRAVADDSQSGSAVAPPAPPGPQTKNDDSATGRSVASASGQPRDSWRGRHAIGAGARFSSFRRGSVDEVARGRGNRAVSGH